mmetsp:Transcript_26647/g.39923  ORF Transcript_26647/g.39923 Transcript_26647/m.39923 type:complete len:240 (+) Transcript_26647:289-1008(+)
MNSRPTIWPMPWNAGAGTTKNLLAHQPTCQGHGVQGRLRHACTPCHQRPLALVEASIPLGRVTLSKSEASVQLSFHLEVGSARSQGGPESCPAAFASGILFAHGGGAARHGPLVRPQQRGRLRPPARGRPRRRGAARLQGHHQSFHLGAVLHLAAGALGAVAEQAQVLADQRRPLGDRGHRSPAGVEAGRGGGRGERGGGGVKGGRRAAGPLEHRRLGRGGGVMCCRIRTNNHLKTGTT